MIVVEARNRGRIAAAVAAIALQMLLICGLIFGLSARVPVEAVASLTLFEIAESPPAVRTIPKPSRRKRPAGRAAPPNLKAKAAEIVAPPPLVLPDIPPPVIAALTPGLGSEASAGAAVAPGPGTGGGGEGTGTGSGGAGSGDGGGIDIPSRKIGGRIRDSDYPRAAGAAGVSGTVSIDYTVGVDGRVSDCAVTRSSGNAELDETTCRLIRQRFRFSPARDAAGKKVPDYWSGDHEWVIRKPDATGREGQQ